eukprot:6230255-Ditylum_brightwellii.AAC.1
MEVISLSCLPLSAYEIFFHMLDISSELMMAFMACSEVMSPIRAWISTTFSLCSHLFSTNWVMMCFTNVYTHNKDKYKKENKDNKDNDNKDNKENKDNKDNNDNKDNKDNKDKKDKDNNEGQQGQG